MELQVFTGQELLEEPRKHPIWVVEGIVPKGFTLFCGPPKIGKSWFMLYLVDRIARGEQVWGHETVKGKVAYLCLEDSDVRISERLGDISADSADETLDELFCMKCDNIAGTLLSDLDKLIEKHSDIALIIIDTLQMIRVPGEEYSYNSDYSFGNKLKQFADSHDIGLLGVHHTRKQESSDPVNRISGTNGLAATADSLVIMVRDSQKAREAEVAVIPRDAEQKRLQIRFDNTVWEVVKVLDEDEVFVRDIPDVVKAVASFINASDSGTWVGSPTELLAVIGDTETASCAITKLINQHRGFLEERGVTYRLKRTSSSRLISLSRSTYDRSDGSDTSE